MSLKDKSILITGASSGIGRGVCSSLLEEGARVAAFGRDILNVSTFCSGYPKLFTFKELNLSQTELIEEGIISICEQFGKFDGMVHCAGIEETVPLAYLTPDKVSDIFALNVFSGLELLRVFSKKKYSNDMASIIFISSVMGILGQPGKIGYCATKAAINGIIKSASLELAKRKIRVNAISPGIVRTPLTEKLFSHMNLSQVDEVIGMHPLGIGTVDDVVPAIKFLLGDESKWITGQNIIIDGGYSVH